MTTEASPPSDDCSTLGVDAVPLERFADISTQDGDTLIYDQEMETAWIQSNLYFSRETCV